MKTKNDETFFQKLGKRIRQEREKRGLTQDELAKKVNLKNYSVITAYESGKNRVQVDTLIRITNYFKIPLIKFLSFSDSETSKTKKDIDLIPYSNHDELYDELQADSNIIKVNVYSVVGAGNFVGFSSFNPINEIYLLKEFYKNGMVAVKVKGESMEPTVREGGYVGIDINDKEYIAGKIYAVFLKDEGVAIKRVFVNDGKAILKSDNPIFPERVVNRENTDDYFLIGRVKWVMQEI